MINSFYVDEDIRLYFTLHRFESGEKYAGSGDFIYGLMSDDFDEGTSLELLPTDDETGLYYCDIAGSTLSAGIYWGIAQVVIDLVDVQTKCYLRIEERPNWLFSL